MQYLHKFYRQIRLEDTCTNGSCYNASWSSVAISELDIDAILEQIKKGDALRALTEIKCGELYVNSPSVASSRETLYVNSPSAASSRETLYENSPSVAS